MAIPNDYQMIWTEIYKGVPNGRNCVDAGWCCCSKSDTLLKAKDKINQVLHNQYPANKFVVLSYPEDRCAMAFKANQRILGVFA